MKKVIVVGCPGSGKTFFSRELQKKTGLPLYHIDLMYWEKDKSVVPKEIFLSRMQEAISKEAFIIDGNYGSTMELRFQACDTVFFLDYPVEVCLGGEKERRGKERPDLPWTEEKEDKEFIDFIKNFREKNRPIILDLIRRYPEKEIHVLTNREETAEYLRKITDD